MATAGLFVADGANTIDRAGGVDRETSQEGTTDPRRQSPPLGAHTSISGGLHRAVERAEELGATALQIFTSQPQRWADPELSDEDVEAFREAVEASKIRVVCSHDSYLINLASEDEELLRKSEAAFRRELERCRRLGVDYLVTHPGNATGGDREVAWQQNARVLGRVLAEEPVSTTVLLETTAGSGTALGWRFEELAAMLDAISAPERDRVGVCLDTAHVFAAGYDLRDDYRRVMRAFDRAVGLERLHLLHLNDSRAPLGSRVDRHAHIGEGELGEAPFRALMRDEGLGDVARVIETPKGEDAAAWDRRNLDLLRSLAAG